MADNWPTRPLKDVVHLQRGHDLPARARRPGPVPVISSGGPSGWHDEPVADGPGVVLGRATNLGKPYWVDGPYWPLNTTLYVRDFLGNDPRYVFHLFRTLDLTGYNSGSVQPMLNRNYIANVPIALPPPDEQRRIAGVLGALDGLIDSNRNEAARLDSLVRHLGQRFLRSQEVESVSRLDELATIVKGYSYKSSELVPGNGWLVNLKNVGRDGTFQPGGLKPLTGNHKQVHVVDNGDLCVAQTDLTQNREVIGRPIRVRRGLAQGEFVASLDLVIVRPGPKATAEYLYAVLDSPDFRSHALAFCNGTTVLHMGAAAVPSFEAPTPDPAVIHVFSERVRTLRATADQALMDAERLVQARDELLPLLLSGRVRVDEVEG